MFLSTPLFAADNEIFIDQTSGASESNIDLEQLRDRSYFGHKSDWRQQQVVRKDHW